MVPMAPPMAPSSLLAVTGTLLLPAVTPGGLLLVTLSACAPLWSSSTVPPEVTMTEPLLWVMTLTGRSCDRELSEACCWSSRLGWLGVVARVLLMEASWLRRLLAELTLCVSVVLAPAMESLMTLDAVWKELTTVCASASTVWRWAALVGLDASVLTSSKNWLMAVWMSPLLVSALEMAVSEVDCAEAAALAVLAFRNCAAAKLEAARTICAGCTPSPGWLGAPTCVVAFTLSAT